MSAPPPSNPIRKFLVLERAEQRVIVQAFLALPVCWLAINTLGLARVSSIVKAKQRARPANALATLEPARLAVLVDIAANRSAFPATCLYRSLVLQWILGRNGFDSDLRIGVALDEKQLSAHAWIEYQGVPLNDVTGLSQRFFPLAGPLAAPKAQR